MLTAMNARRPTNDKRCRAPERGHQTNARRCPTHNNEVQIMAQNARMTRTMAGLLKSRLPDARLDEVADPRDPRGQRWGLPTLLTTLVVALTAGGRSLAQAEMLTAELSSAARRLLGIDRRVPDTTLRETACRLDPGQLRGALQATAGAAQRRKALRPEGFPFGVVALDGKATALPSCDDWYAQRKSNAEGEVMGLLRTVSCALVSCRAKPLLDAVPIPAPTNEMGVFQHALDELMATYGSCDLFRLISYDAGACSEDNARAVRQHGLHYLFGLKAGQPTLLAEAEAWLGSLPSEQAMAQTEDALSGGRRCVRRLYATEELAGFGGWDHLRMMLRVESETLDAQGRRLAYENRYFVSSLPACRLTASQWLRLVRNHWGVENECHGTLDLAFEEDDHPWIEAHPRGALAIALLRRIAYNLLTLFRSVTQRSDERRRTPWRTLMHWLHVALLTAKEALVAGLRARRLAAA